ncbi:MAG: hypothetical protein ACFFCW_00595 [Candidatus Hodarchaeota archaeon]
MEIEIETKYISLSRLASHLGLPANYLRELSNKYLIPRLNVKGRLRFNPEAVQKALDDLAANGGGDNVD